MNEIYQKYKNRDDGMSVAYLIIKNLLNKDIGNKELFDEFLNTSMQIIEMPITFEERYTILNEVESAFMLFMDNTEIKEETLDYYRLVKNKISDTHNKIQEEEEKQYKEGFDKILEENRKKISELANKNSDIKKANSQKGLEKVLEEIKKIDDEIDTDFLDDNIQKVYEQNEELRTKLVYEKIEEIQRSEKMNYNVKAANDIQYVYNELKHNKNKYISQQGNLKNLLQRRMFILDMNRLFNETIVYYNFVYNWIFQNSDIDDGLKFKITEWAAMTEKE